MKFKNYILGKIKRNIILFILIILGLITTSLGFYYNLIRESKTTYHYTFRDSIDNTKGLFFLRNTDRNEDKNVIDSIFTYKKDTILNFTANKVYFISDDANYDEVKVFDFDTKKDSFLFQNEDKETLKDTFLDKNFLLILSEKNLITINLENKNNSKFEIKNLGKFNEFFNKKGDEIFLRFDNCKFLPDPCYYEEPKELLSFNLKTTESRILKISDTEESVLKNKPYFGTNKIYKLGTLKKYKDDEGNKNYNFRIFTQF